MSPHHLDPPGWDWFPATKPQPASQDDPEESAKSWPPLGLADAAFVLSLVLSVAVAVALADALLRTS
jgi:hypothetical protein